VQVVIKRLHKVIFPILVAMLVAGGVHVLLGEYVVVGMILLPLFFLPLLGLPGLFLSLQASPRRQQVVAWS
jgi:hypothetical protein